MGLLTLLGSGGVAGEQRTVTAAVANAVVPSAAVSRGAVTRTVTSAVATGVAPSASRTLGGLTVGVAGVQGVSLWVANQVVATISTVRAVTAVFATGVVPSAGRTIGGVTRAVTAAVANSVAPAAARTSAITKTVTAAFATGVVPTASRTAGGLTVGVAGIQGAATWVVPNAATGSGATKAVTAAFATCVVPSASRSLGGLTKTVSSAPAWWQTLAASVVIGAITSATAAASAVWSVPSAVAGESTGNLTVPHLASSATCYAPTVPKVVLEVRESTTLRATRDLALTDALATSDLALTTAERNSIESWALVRVSAIANGTQVEIGWLELQAPAAGSTQAVTLATIAASAVLYSPSVAHGGVGEQTLTLSTIAATAVLYAPSVPTYTFVLSHGQDPVTTRVVPVTTTLADWEYTLSTEERAALSDWGSLKASVVANGAQIEVSWLALQAPVAAGTNELLMPHIPSSATLFAGNLGGYFLEAAHIASAAVLHPPSLSQRGLVVRLSDGDTVWASWNVGLTSDLQTIPILLDTTQRDAIQNWPFLKVELVANGEQVRVTWVKFDTPGQAPIDTPLLASTAVLYPPEVAYGGGVMVPILPARAVTYAPALEAGALTRSTTTVLATWVVPTAVSFTPFWEVTPAVVTWGVPSAAVSATKTVTASSASCVWTVPTAGIYLPSVARVLYVSHQGRTITLTADDRTIEVGANTRIIIVPEE